MIDVATMVDPVYDHNDRVWGHELDHRQSPTGTRPAASLHQRSMAGGVIRMIVICVMSSATEMHTTRYKTNAKSESALSRNDTTRVTMIIMVPSMTGLTDYAPLKEGLI
jgi:hypothetical protein